NSRSPPPPPRASVPRARCRAGTAPVPEPPPRKPVQPAARTAGEPPPLTSNAREGLRSSPRYRLRRASIARPLAHPKVLRPLRRVGAAAITDPEGLYPDRLFRRGRERPAFTEPRTLRVRVPDVPQRLFRPLRPGLGRALLIRDPAELLYEHRHAGALALRDDRADPVDVAQARTGPALPADDHPVDPGFIREPGTLRPRAADGRIADPRAQVHRPEKRLAGEEAHGGGGLDQVRDPLVSRGLVLDGRA